MHERIDDADIAYLGANEREADDLAVKCAALEAEAARLREAIASRDDAIHAAAREITETRDEVARLREALEYIADSAIGRAHDGGSCTLCLDVQHHAQRALRNEE